LIVARVASILLVGDVSINGAKPKGKRRISRGAAAPCGPPEVPVAVRTSRLPCKKRRKSANILASPWTSGESRFHPTFWPAPSRVSVPFAPKHVGRKETSCSYLQSSKENR